MKKIIPNTITLLSLLSACLAIYCSFHPLEDMGCGTPGYKFAFYFILLSAVADFCDGLAARLLGAQSELGVQLDSLSDVVAFGVAPAMLLLNLFQACGAPRWLCLLCLLIPLMGALRLARFNTDKTQTTSFLGLPIPSCALFCIGLAALTVSTGGVGLYAAAGCVAAIALLMVVPVRMYSLKMKNFRLVDNLLRYILLVVAALCLWFFGWEGFFYIIAYYVISSFIVGLFPVTKIETPQD